MSEDVGATLRYPTPVAILKPAQEPTIVGLRAKLVRAEVGLDDLRADLESDADTEWFEVDDGTTLRHVGIPSANASILILVRRRPTATTGWKRLLRRLGLPLDTTPRPDNESVIVIARTATTPARLVLWCFGAGSLAVPDKHVDGRFGLIAALNKQAALAENGWREHPVGARSRTRMSSDGTSVRSLDADIRDGVRHRMSARSYSASPVETLGFDTVTDLLRGIRVTTLDDLMPDVEGGRSLHFSTYIESWQDFALLTDYVVNLRSRDDYRRDWEWIDHVVPVEPRSEVERILGRLYDKIVGDKEPHIDLALPELGHHEQSRSSQIQFGLARQPPISGPPEWRIVREQLLRLPPTRVPLDREIKFRVEGAPPEEFARTPLSSIMVTEFAEADQQYLLGDGELLRVNADFISRTDERLSRIAWSEFDFPMHRNTVERVYLEEAAAASRDIALLDQFNIVLPGETAFEPCDLFCADRRLVYAKLRGRSSTFSHLCTQAEVAAEMLLRHGAARDQFLDKMDESTAHPHLLDAGLDAMERLERREPGTVHVTLLLIGVTTDLKSLPLLSRVRLLRTAQRIVDLGYHFSVATPEALTPQQNRRSHPQSRPRLADMRFSSPVTPSTTHSKGVRS